MEKNTNGSANTNASFVLADNGNKEIKNEIINAKPSSSQASPDVSKVHIPKETIERLLKDIKDIYVSSLEADGIYYKHSDTNILK